jgi:cold shock CspA family protein
MKCIPAEGITNEALTEAVGKDLFKIGFAKCMQNKWVKKDKATGLITPLVESPKDELQVCFIKFSYIKETLKELKEMNGSISKIAPGSADAKNLIRRQMFSLV